MKVSTVLANPKQEKLHQNKHLHLLHPLLCSLHITTLGLSAATDTDPITADMNSSAQINCISDIIHVKVNLIEPSHTYGLPCCVSVSPHERAYGT